MRRIGLAVVVALGVFVWPLVADTQETGKVYRIGFLRAGQPPRTFVEAFQQGLRARGYIDGRNVVIEYRSTDGSFDELPRLATELVRLNVDDLPVEQPTKFEPVINLKAAKALFRLRRPV